VGKTFVADLIASHQQQIAELCRQIAAQATRYPKWRRTAKRAR
jgi:hypothetical protein